MGCVVGLVSGLLVRAVVLIGGVEIDEEVLAAGEAGGEHGEGGQTGENGFQEGKTIGFVRVAPRVEGGWRYCLQFM